MSTEWDTRGEGQSVLWFPGFMESRAQILDQLAVLATSYHVSVVPPRPLLTLQGTSEVARQYMTANSMNTMHVLGTSSGTRAAMSFVMTHPHHVSSVYLVSPWLEPDRKASDTFSSWNVAAESSMSTEHLAHAVLSSMSSARAHSDGVVDRWCQEYLDQFRDSAAARRDLSAQLLGLLQTGPKMNDLWRAIPTVIASGCEDQILGDRHARRIWARIPLSKHEVVDSAGHLAHLEQPSRFWSSLRNFWSVLAAQHAATRWETGQAHDSLAPFTRMASMI